MGSEGAGNMNGPYVNEDGDFWLERDGTPWPRILAEAASWAHQMGDWDSVMRYDGIQKDVRVSDELEYVHGDDDGCADAQGTTIDDPGFTPCCRTTTCYAFHVGSR